MTKLSTFRAVWLDYDVDTLEALEVGGKVSTRRLSTPQGQTKKPMRECVPKDKRKPDYAGAREQKRNFE